MKFFKAKKNYWLHRILSFTMILFVIEPMKPELVAQTTSKYSDITESNQNSLIQ